MADPDPQDLIDLAERAARGLTLQEVITLPQAHFEVLRRAALAQIAFDPGQPAAARVAALRDLGEDPQTGAGTGSPDPSEMTLEDIERELAKT